MMSAKQFSTAELAVPGVEVVNEKPDGRAFAGPFYDDQLSLLRETLRGMPKREQYVVFAANGSHWIYRK